MPTSPSRPFLAARIIVGSTWKPLPSSSIWTLTMSLRPSTVTRTAVASL
jgi:hypothetical protein